MEPDRDGPENAGAEPTDGSQVPYEITDDDRTWGILVHAVAFVGFIIPLGNILGPLIVWAIKKEESRFVDENGKQAVNFQITWTILLIASALSIFVLIGLVLFPLVAIAWLVLVIIVIIRTSNNEVYEYPLTLDLID